MTAIRVHGLDHARAALSAARELGVTVTLVSPKAAASFAGVGWWRELVRLAEAEFPDVRFQAVLDCGPSTGMALAAIRARVGPLRLETDAATLAKIAGIAEQVEIRVECEGEETLDLLGAPDPGGSCREALGKDHEGTEAGGAVRGERQTPLPGG